MAEWLPTTAPGTTRASEHSSSAPAKIQIIVKSWFILWELLLSKVSDVYTLVDSIQFN